MGIFNSNPFQRLAKNTVRDLSSGIRTVTKKMRSGKMDPKVEADLVAGYQEKVGGAIERGTEKIADAAVDKAIADMNRGWFARNKVLTGLGALGIGAYAVNSMNRGDSGVNMAADAGAQAAMQEFEIEQAAARPYMIDASSAKHMGVMDFSMGRPQPAMG